MFITLVKVLCITKIVFYNTLKVNTTVFNFDSSLNM